MSKRSKGLCAVVMGFMASCMAIGCGSHVKYTQVELHGLLGKERGSPEHPVLLGKGESVSIKDPQIAEKLSSFFPGLGSGRKSYWAVGSAKTLELVFSDETGHRITVYTRSLSYDFWGSGVDRGDLDVKGDLKSYLEALFTNVKVQETTSTQQKE